MPPISGDGTVQAPASGLSTLQPVLETSLDAVVMMSAEGTVLDWNARAENMFGWTRDEVVGREVTELIVPKWARAAHWAGLRRVLSDGPPRILGHLIEISALRRDGSEFPVELSISRPKVAHGQIFVAFIRDISVRKRDEMALRTAERRLRATQDYADVGIAEIDAAGRYLRVNPALCKIVGLTEEELLSKNFLDITHPDDRAEESRLFAEQVAGRLNSYIIEKRFRRDDGREVWVSIAASSVRDDEDTFLFGVRVIQDITERRLAENRQKLLLDELNHRVKHSLALVLAIASQTGPGAADYKAFHQAFVARIKALAKSQELLTRERWEGAQLRELLEIELALRAVEPGRIRLLGPPVWLDAHSAVDVGLIAHELAANATVHGALSTEGAVEVSWSLQRLDGRRQVKLCWQERGGPPSRVPQHQGFGVKLINRLARDNLAGEANWHFEPTGLRVEITFITQPDADTTANQSPAEPMER